MWPPYTWHDIPGSCTTIAGKAQHELFRKWIQVIRVPVVAEIPDRKYLCLIYRVDHRIDKRKVVLTRTLVHQRPGYTFPRNGNTEVAQQLVICLSMFTVLRFLNEVAPLLIPPEKG